MIAGMSNVGSLEGSLNLAVALERALYNGAAPSDETSQAPSTGAFDEFLSYEAFEAAVRKHIEWMTEDYVHRNAAQH